MIYREAIRRGRYHQTTLKPEGPTGGIVVYQTLILRNAGEDVGIRKVCVEKEDASGNRIRDFLMRTLLRIDMVGSEDAHKRFQKRFSLEDDPMKMSGRGKVKAPRRGMRQACQLMKKYLEINRTSRRTINKDADYHR